MEHSRIPEDVVWEVFDTIVIGEHAGAPGARNLGFTTVLAIPVAEAAAWRDRATLEGEADFCASEATGHRN